MSTTDNTPQASPDQPTSYMPGATPPAGGQPQPKRSVPLLAAVAIGAAAVLVSCVGGVAIGSAGTSSKPATIRYSASPYPVVSTVTVTKTVQAAPPPSPPPPATVTISTGQWIVGDDFPAGTYEVTSDSDSCYWDITRSGSNHHDYIQQELGRGHWKIALKQGYDFTTKDCGLWRKVG